MSFEQKNNSGSLFKNNRKESERHPDYTGNALINGKTLRLAAWVKTAKSGQKFLSLAFSDPEQRQQPPQPAPFVPTPYPIPQPPACTDPNDGLPF